MIFTGAVACSGEKGTSGQKVDSIREHQSKSLISAGKNREKPDTTKEVLSERVVVENNFFKPQDLPLGMADYGQSVSSLAISMAQNDGSIEEINAALTKAVKGTHPEGQDPALGILIAWGNLTGIPLDVFLTQQEMTPEKAVRKYPVGMQEQVKIALKIQAK